MRKSMFKAFLAAAPYFFCDETYWRADKRGNPWDILFPCLQQNNTERQQLARTMLLILCESMLGWRPKTTECEDYQIEHWNPGNLCH